VHIVAASFIGTTFDPLEFTEVALAASWVVAKAS
jgi:hypothetical protein